MSTDYWGILEAVKSILDEIPGTYAFIEMPLDAYTTSGPEVGIFLNTEENEEHTIGVDNPYLTTLHIELVCQEFSPDGVEESCKKRDALIGKVRDALKADRTLKGKVQTSQFGNPTFETARAEAGFYSAASIPLSAFLFS